MVTSVHRCRPLTPAAVISTLLHSDYSRHAHAEDAMPVNTKKVLVGGLVAGVIINIIDFVSNAYILGARMKAETDAFKPGLSDTMTQGSSVISYIIMDLVRG